MIEQDRSLQRVQTLGNLELRKSLEREIPSNTQKRPGGEERYQPSSGGGSFGNRPAKGSGRVERTGAGGESSSQAGGIGPILKKVH